MKKIKSWLQSKTVKMAAVASVAAGSLMGVASAAEGETADVVDTVSASMTTAISSFAGKAASILGQIVVVAIPIAGAIWLATKAFGWFKKTSK